MAQINFPDTIETGSGITLYRCDMFERGALSSGQPGVSSLIQDGVIYRAERLFNIISFGGRVNCCICSDACYPNTFEPVLVDYTDDCLYYVANVSVNAAHTVTAAWVVAYDNDGDEVASTYYVF